MTQAPETHGQASEAGASGPHSRRGTLPYPGAHIRHVRVADPLWDEAKEAAQAEGITLADAMRDGLKQLVRRHRRRQKTTTKE